MLSTFDPHCAGGTAEIDLSASWRVVGRVDASGARGDGGSGWASQAAGGRARVYRGAANGEASGELQPASARVDDRRRTDWGGGSVRRWGMCLMTIASAVTSACTERRKSQTGGQRHLTFLPGRIE